MKTPTPGRIVLAFLFAATLAVLCAPGTVRNTVNLVWDAYDWEGDTNSCGFVLYEQVGTNWLARVSAVRTATQLTLMNVSPGVHIYAITASNYWGESDLSAPVSTPKLIGKPVNVRLTN